MSAPWPAEINLERGLLLCPHRIPDAKLLVEELPSAPPAGVPEGFDSVLPGRIFL